MLLYIFGGTIVFCVVWLCVRMCCPDYFGLGAKYVCCWCADEDKNENQPQIINVIGMQPSNFDTKNSTFLHSYPVKSGSAVQTPLQYNAPPTPFYFEW